MSKFLGPKRIENQVEDGDHVILEFKDGTKDRVSKKMLEISSTREPVDHTVLWDRQLSPVAHDILQVLFDWDVQLEQLEYLFNILKSSLEHNNVQAVEILFGNKKSERRISDIDRVLKKAKEANGAEQK